MQSSPAVELIWRLAVVETLAARQECIEPENFLEALTKGEQLCADGAITDLRAQGIDIASLDDELQLMPAVLRDCAIDPRDFRHELRKLVGHGSYQHSKGEAVHRSSRSRKVFACMKEMAKSSEMATVTLGHLFLAILEEQDSVGCRLLREKGANLEKLVEEALQRIQQLPQPQPAGAQPPEDALDQTTTPFLVRFGRDLTKEAREGKLGPIIGRRKEILQVIQTLARRSKNNPVLVGKAGVGKTAIVEALAIRAAEGKDPRVLAGKQIIELSMGVLTAGTKYRGEFEERLTRVLVEVRANPDVIVFIDELHTVIGAGRGDGSMDAANLMKPALARGDLRCIGATTIAEYRRYIESDAALERRFEKVIVPEPTQGETLQILRGLRPKWEEHHRVQISEAALGAAVDLSMRFDTDHHLPDKAIDLVDKAGARTRIPKLSMRRDGSGAVATVNDDGAAGDIIGEVTELTIAQVLSEKIALPLEVITGHMEGMSRSRLVEMEAALKKRVIGQNEAVERVCQRLLMSHAGLGPRTGSLGVFLFLGPTGVGKTELARSVALFVFGSEREMIRLDMSEFMEQHSVAKLIGSPPGYIGHEEEGQLTGKLRSRPYSIVLLDEIEKAHPRVFDLFLQVFEEGRLTDSKGRTTDARNAIFIMTSNITPERHAGIGFGGSEGEAAKNALSRALGAQFRSEFVNRIDEVIVFRPLNKEHVKTILGFMLEEITSSLREKHHKLLQVSPEAIEIIAAQGYSDKFGVRHLRRTVHTLVEAPLSRLILSEELKRWQSVVFDVQNNKVVLREGEG